MLKGPLYQVVTVYVRPSEEWGIKLRFLDEEMGEEGKESSKRKGMERKNGQGGDVRDKSRLPREEGGTENVLEVVRSMECTHTCD